MTEKIIVCMLAILGIHNAFQEGNIFFRLRAAIEYHLPVMIRKPLFICLPCKASIYGTLLWLCYPYPIGQFIVFILALSGLLYIIELIIPDVD